MDMIEPVMRHPHDHIMANTWRLIFERKSRYKAASPTRLPDFKRLEQLLPEYRLIGLCLANDSRRRPN